MKIKMTTSAVNKTSTFSNGNTYDTDNSLMTKELAEAFIKANFAILVEADKVPEKTPDKKEKVSKTPKAPKKGTDK